ncbi:hypothetical protein TNCT1_38580 [Streptomyces sp. 1-11]|nr:hypothetical protein TNCT1_38580 [Streptomyces sp. 1-11]
MPQKQPPASTARWVPTVIARSLALLLVRSSSLRSRPAGIFPGPGAGPRVPPAPAVPARTGAAPRPFGGSSGLPAGVSIDSRGILADARRMPIETSPAGPPAPPPRARGIPRETGAPGHRQGR